MENIIKAVNNLEFVYAKSMPHIPHFYTVKSEQNKIDYETLFWHILHNGYDKYFYGKTYRYCTIGIYEYWIMSDDINVSKIINRRLIV